MWGWGLDRVYSLRLVDGGRRSEFDPAKTEVSGREHNLTRAVSPVAKLRPQQTKGSLVETRRVSSTLNSGTSEGRTSLLPDVRLLPVALPSVETTFLGPSSRDLL